MRKLIFLIVVLAAAYAAFHFFMGGSKGGQQHGGPGMGGPSPVDMAKVERRRVVAWDEFSGRLQAVDRVEVRPRVEGTIDAVHFSEGQLVQKGQILFTIDPKPFEAALKAARAKASYTQAEFVRARELVAKKIVAQSQYDDKRNAAEVAGAELAKAELDIGYTQIRSPIAGRVGRAEITVGNLVSSGGAAPLLTTVVSIDPIYADAEVDEQNYVRYLQAAGGNPDALKNIPVQLALSGEDNFSFTGHLQSFDNELNTRAGTVRMRAVFDNKNGALITGLYARLRIGGAGEQDLVLIKEGAIGTDQNKKFVYVVNAESKAEYRVVTLGPVVEGMRVITSGLSEGETIIVGGLQRVMPGAPVMQDTPAPAAH